MAIVGPWLLTGLTITGVLGLLVGTQVLIDRLAPLPAEIRVQPVISHTPPLTPKPVKPVRTEAGTIQTTHLAQQPSFPGESVEVSPRAYAEGTVFQVADARTGKLIWTYAREAAALGFVRDVVRVRCHADAAQFELRIVHHGARTLTVAQGEQLVRRALEDRVL
jgi:hypothetical protein